MTQDESHLKGGDYSCLHGGWGGFSDELLFHTSRYYAVVEAFLRHLSGKTDFKMAGFKASDLSVIQRVTMTHMLEYEPDPEVGAAIVNLIEAVLSGDENADESISSQCPGRAKHLKDPDIIGHVPKQHMLDVNPLEPFLEMAERLQIAVAIKDHHVEIDMKLLASYLDSANSVLRNNLQKCIIDLHENGYRIRNHPHLTHHEAIETGDTGSV